MYSGLLAYLRPQQDDLKEATLIVGVLLGGLLFFCIAVLFGIQPLRRRNVHGGEGGDASNREVRASKGRALIADDDVLWSPSIQKLDVADQLRPKIKSNASLEVIVWRVPEKLWSHSQARGLVEVAPREIEKLEQTEIDDKKKKRNIVKPIMNKAAQNVHLRYKEAAKKHEQRIRSASKKRTGHLTH